MFTEKGNDELQRVQYIYDILHGNAEADLLIKNVKILDVFGETVDAGTILVDGGKIVALSPDENIVKVRDVFDGSGLYAIPGLIDAHFHFESQLAHPGALAEFMVPCGTTTCYVEILDLVSSAKEEGFEAAKGLFNNYEKLPYRVYGFAPGKKVAYDISRQIMDMNEIIGLGEFDHFSYSTANEEDFKKAAYANKLGKFINGHWGLTTLSPLELNYLPAIGVTNNHDVWNAEDIERSLKYGFATQIKFGVGDVTNLLKPIIYKKYPTENFTFCSDNVSVSHLKNKGHMDFIINKAVSMGLDPIKAIKMASLNTARHFKMDDKLGSLAPGRYADIVLTDSLSRIDPEYVFKNGELVASAGKLLNKVEISYSSMNKEGKPGCSDLTAEELNIRPLEISEDGSKAKVYLFDLFGRGHAKFYQEIWLPVVDGKIVEEYDGQPLVRISVIERYSAGKERNVVNGYFKGIQIDRGAIGTSFPAPKPYIVVIGKDTGEMHFAVQRVDEYSGACIVTENETIKAVLPIEIYGMMADLSAEELLEKSDGIDRAAEELGHVNSGEPVANKLLSLFISLDRFNFIR